LATRNHVTRRRLQAEQGPRHVHGEQLVMVGPGDVHDWRRRKQRGVVDQDVKFPHFSNGFSKGRVDAVLFRHIQRNGMGLGAELCHCLLGRSKVDVGNHHLCAFGQIGPCKSQTDTARGAGNQGGLSLKSHIASPFASKR